MITRRLISLELMLALCFSLSTPVRAAEITLPLDYGKVLFEDAVAEGTVTCGEEELELYSVIRGSKTCKYGIKPATVITVYNVSVEDGAAVLKDVRFLYDKANFAPNYGEGYFWWYRFKEDEVGSYRLIDVRSEGEEAAEARFIIRSVEAGGVGVTVGESPVLWSDALPFIDENNRTMVPLRAVGDALGLTVGWDAAAREASFTDGSRTIYFPIGSNLARTDSGETVEMNTAAVIVNNRTYAPVRYLAEFFDRSVGWTAETRTVLIQ